MKARGFTLLEVMIVAVVASVLFCIAYATYGHWIERAQTAKAVADIGAIHMAVQRFDLNARRYPTGLGEVGLESLTDPWGNPYQFLSFDGIDGNGPKRKNKNLVPVNTSYDIYSMGPDGATSTPFTSSAGGDDIVMAGDGTYFGVAGDYK